MPSTAVVPGGGAAAAGADLRHVLHDHGGDAVVRGGQQLHPSRRPPRLGVAHGRGGMHGAARWEGPRGRATMAQRGRRRGVARCGAGGPFFFFFPPRAPSDRPRLQLAGAAGPTLQPRGLPFAGSNLCGRETL